MNGARPNYPIEDRLAEEAAAARVRELEAENAKLREERSKFDASHDWDAAMRENTKLREEVATLRSSLDSHLRKR